MISTQREQPGYQAFADLAQPGDETFRIRFQFRDSCGGPGEKFNRLTEVVQRPFSHAYQQRRGAIFVRFEEVGAAGEQFGKGAAAAEYDGLSVRRYPASGEDVPFGGEHIQFIDGCAFHRTARRVVFHIRIILFIIGKHVAYGVRSICHHQIAASGELIVDQLLFIGQIQTGGKFVEISGNTAFIFAYFLFPPELIPVLMVFIESAHCLLILCFL